MELKWNRRCLLYRICEKKDFLHKERVSEVHTFQGSALQCYLTTIEGACQWGPLTKSCGPWVWTLVGHSGPSFRHMKTIGIALDLLGACICTHFWLKLGHKEKGPRIRDILVLLCSVLCKWAKIFSVAKDGSVRVFEENFVWEVVWSDFLDGACSVLPTAPCVCVC